MDDLSHPGSGDDGDGAPPLSSGREMRLNGLRADIERGLEDIKAGRVVDLEAAMDRVEAMLDELEAAKRAGA